MPTIYNAELSQDSVPLVLLRKSHSPDPSILSSDFDHLLEDDNSSAASDDNDHGLPRTDGGRQAWTFLLGSWLIEAMLWGFPLSFGIFEKYYDARFDGDKSIPTIGMLATGVSYLGMPLVNAVIIRWPQYKRAMCFGGWGLCVFALVGASLATKVWQLLVFQGALYGVGWVICYTPALFFLNEWFVEKRGLAYGILFGASGVSGLFIPLAIGTLLDRYGHGMALATYAGAVVVLSGPGLFMIKPRITRLSKHAINPQAAVGLTGLVEARLRPNFIIFNLALFIQGLGFFIPNTFLPSFVEDLKLPASTGNSLLSLVSLAQVPGQIGLGYVADKLNPHIPTSAATLISGVAALFLWGSARGVHSLAPFAILWGLFSAAYSVMYMRICVFLAGPERSNDAAMTVCGLFAFERGAAMVLAGPISAFLVSGGGGVDSSAYALGKYAYVVYFTGACMLLSSFGIVGLLWPRGMSQAHSVTHA